MHCDEDNNPSDNHVLLPGCGEICNVLYSVLICNNGAADLTSTESSTACWAAATA